MYINDMYMHVRGFAGRGGPPQEPVPSGGAQPVAPQTPNPQPSTLNPKPQILNPEPKSSKPKT